MDVHAPATVSLSSCFLFRDLPKESLARVAALAKTRKFSRKQTIFSVGDVGDALYGIIAGKVRIVANAEDGREVFLNILNSGAVFGEVAVIDGKSRTAGAIAIEDSVLWAIERTEFLRLLHEDPELSVHLLQVFCERIRWTSGLVEDSVFLNVPHRLGKRLLQLVSTNGEQVEEGYRLRISQGELAQFLSVSRQVVNQHLQDWRKSGVVSLTRGSITILDMEGLQSSLTPTKPSE